MGILEAVKDEGHFWENRDVKALVKPWASGTGISLDGRAVQDQIGGIIARSDC